MTLSQRYADKRLHPASLTKVMTLLLTFDALERGDIRLRDRVRISRHAASMVPSKLGLPAGSSIRVEDAIYSLVTKSANDIAVALAEHLGGSEARFAQYMTGRAKGIGMQSTNFMNASGLHHKYQVSTARDMAKMARYIVRRYPKYYRYFSTRSFTYRGKTYRNHNRLMSSYSGMDGFKTGYINASGFNLIASAKKDGRRLIGVVFGGRTSKTRNSHMASILDKGFSKAKRVRMASIDKAPPKPNRKPGSATTVASAAPKTFVQNPQGFTSFASLETGRKAIANAPVDPKENLHPNYTALSEALESAEFQKRIGVGDFDPAVTKRLETGLIAVSVHKGDYEAEAPVSQDMMQGISRIAPEAGTPTKAVYHPNHHGAGEWAIQIGAYGSRLATDQKLYKAKAALPADIAAQVKPLAVPLRTAEGVVFRARLSGMSEQQAVQACRYFQNCMTIAPVR
ncbi:MAG: D-alanyl-D-alanine carboxypeptidase [Alphaproteobacteria bacterium]|nr:D-alanyl-D-alanine carboxypeptidase [Alphaproteobacteria bacterium]